MTKKEINNILKALNITVKSTTEFKNALIILYNALGFNIDYSRIIDDINKKYLTTEADINGRILFYENKDKCEYVWI